MSLHETPNFTCLLNQFWIITFNRLNPQQSINDPDECTLLKYTILKSIPFERSTSFGVHPKIEALLKIKNSRIWITVDTIEKPVLCAKPLRL